MQFNIKFTINVPEDEVADLSALDDISLQQGITLAIFGAGILPPLEEIDNIDVAVVR